MKITEDITSTITIRILDSVIAATLPGFSDPLDSLSEAWAVVVVAWVVVTNDTDPPGDPAELMTEFELVPSSVVSKADVSSRETADGRTVMVEKLAIDVDTEDV